MLLGDDPPNELERIAADRIAALLALELARDAAVRQAREETRRGDPLPAEGPPWVVVLARQAAADRPDDIAAREETRAELRLLVSPRRLALRGTSESLELRLVAAAPADDPDGLAIAGRIASFLARAVAVSRPFEEPGARPAAEASARATLEAVEALDDPPVVGRASRLPAYLLLGERPEPARRAAPGAGAAGARSRRAARRPAGAAADAPGRARGAAASARRRHGSASTGTRVAYRVGRLEALGGWDLSDPDLRFALGVATRILRRGT